jgi:hypothetical protein
LGELLGTFTDFSVYIASIAGSKSGLQTSSSTLMMPIQFVLLPKALFPILLFNGSIEPIALTYKVTACKKIGELGIVMSYHPPGYQPKLIPLLKVFFRVQ